ncbi:unnamed protein product [Lota lota]
MVHDARLHSEELRLQFKRISLAFYKPLFGSGGNMLQSDLGSHHISSVSAARASIMSAFSSKKVELLCSTQLVWDVLQQKPREGCGATGNNDTGKHSRFYACPSLGKAGEHTANQGAGVSSPIYEELQQQHIVHHGDEGDEEEEEEEEEEIGVY